MNIVLLSGGSGKRLWPLSNEVQSKQFLKLLKNERGKYESMVQRVTRQLGETHPNAKIFISGNAAQAAVLQRQLGAVEMILEPSRRDTFPAISLAAAYLRYRKQLDQSDTFVVCSIDVFADSEFFKLLGTVEKLVSSGEKQIGLMGVVPTYPSEKYGYINREANEVISFVEKPAETEAKQLISGGALWNGGVFALKIGYALKHTRNYIDFNSYESFYEQYEKLPQVSFDYEVVEKERSIGFAVFNGMWKDLGTWNTLTDEMTDKSMGDNVFISDTCTNTHVLNMLDIPIIAHDLTDTVIVASHDGILITSKHGSASIKPFVELLSGNDIDSSQINS